MKVINNHYEMNNIFLSTYVLTQIKLKSENCQAHAMCIELNFICYKGMS